MKEIELIAPDKIQFSVDLAIYNPTVISKVLYHLAGDFTILRSKETEKEEIIIIQPNHGTIEKSAFPEIKEKISRLFVDFHLRQIITEETKNIRDILYVKAFAQGEEFEDHYLNE